VRGLGGSWLVVLSCGERVKFSQSPLTFGSFDFRATPPRPSAVKGHTHLSIMAVAMASPLHGVVRHALSNLVFGTLLPVPHIPARARRAEQDSAAWERSHSDANCAKAPQPIGDVVVPPPVATAASTARRPQTTNDDGAMVSATPQAGAAPALHAMPREGTWAGADGSTSVDNDGIKSREAPIAPVAASSTTTTSSSSTRRADVEPVPMPAVEPNKTGSARVASTPAASRDASHASDATSELNPRALRPADARSTPKATVVPTAASVGLVGATAPLEGVLTTTQARRTLDVGDVAAAETAREASSISRGATSTTSITSTSTNTSGNGSGTRSVQSWSAGLTPLDSVWPRDHRGIAPLAGRDEFGVSMGASSAGVSQVDIERILATAGFASEPLRVAKEMLELVRRQSRPRLLRLFVTHTHTHTHTHTLPHTHTHTPCHTHSAHTHNHTRLPPTASDVHTAHTHNHVHLSHMPPCHARLAHTSICCSSLTGHISTHALDAVTT
jgi:hypothetical protein